MVKQNQSSQTKSVVLAALDTLWRTVLLATLLVAGYWTFKHFIPTPEVSLPPIKTPPAFSVDYLYSSSSTLGFLVDSSQEIDKNISEIKNAGFGGVKIIFNLNQPDNAQSVMIAKAAAKGVYPLGQLNGHNAKPPSRAFTEDELKNWEKFTRETVRKYKNTVYFWEVWNEPGMTELRFRYGTPEEYFLLLKRTYAIIKEENPLAQVILTTDMGDQSASAFTDGLMALSPEPYFDILSLHPYGDNDNEINEANFTKKIADERTMMERYHIDKPLMISEIGEPSERIGEDEQARRAEFAFKTAYEQNIPIVWFHFSDKFAPSIDGRTGWGLMRPDGSPKPAYERLKAFIKSVGPQ